MKKFISIFLLCQLLTNNMFSEELIKLPKLFTHYFHHSEEHKDTKNFFDYLHKHYCSTHKEEDHNEHNEEDNGCSLPFKHCGGCCISAHTSVLAFMPPFVDANCLFFQTNYTDFNIEDDNIESSDLSSIWQPPKIS